ncbi:MAG: SDR family NAD(P)-dependent oxidoreductase [Symploca sp. SIO2G7]|nr:SDR family NAD(P)-dependent oxidoreductase [Symploca sp. SIO2G7]
MSNVTAKNNNEVELMKKALVELRKTKAKLQTLESAKSEPIAIIGLGCRCPGGSDEPEAYWKMLWDGIDAAIEVPKDRWDIDDYYDPDPDTLGKMYTRYANFLTQVDKFDPEFFGISPREAKWMDPQHRLLLEVIWESLEYAGLSPTDLRGSQTGIFVGMMNHEYIQLINRSGQIEPFFGIGSATAAGRLAFFLGVHGPTLTVETACSSSLVACHLACQSLRNQECNLALVAGINLILIPETSLFESRARMNSEDGRCKAFDASADGIGRGEGCGGVVLKRLSDAVADGDNILALIRGSAVNHDGPSSGLTVPYGPAQEKVIHQALSDGQVDPAAVDYLECHGTGTSLGDPIEVEALVATYGKNRTQDRPLIIGSAKTNIGHLEAAAGIAGLIKVVLSLQKQKIPPHLHLKQPNPRIPWAEIPVVVPIQGRHWLKGERKRLAGVSSFGVSGTNAHLVLEEAPSLIKTESNCKRPVHILTLSAKTPKAFNELVDLYLACIKTHQELELGDICYTANTGRAHFNYRLAVVASNRQELVEKLQQYQQGEEVAGIFLREQPNHTTAPKIAFLFTGQGAQYVNMGRQLYQQAPTFREAINQCEQILSSVETFQEKSLREILYPTDQDNSSLSLLDQTAYTQPCLFSIEYALCKLWKSWGIKPDVVMGHSVGEYVAATIAGIFSLEDGLKLIATRGKLMQKLPASGAMISVIAKKSKVAELVTKSQGKVAIAAINGPESIVISGEAQAIGEIVSILETEGIKTKELEVSHAFHSPLMEPMLVEFEKVANQLTYHQPRIPLLSNVTGTRADKSIGTAQYWVNHVSQPVRFAQSMKTLHQQGYELFLEIGPKPILLGMGRQCLPEQVGVWLPSLRQGVEAWPQMLSSLGHLYVRGAKIDWLKFDQEYSHQKVVLPTYPFQRERYWIESNKNLTKRQKLSTRKKPHPLLGEKLNCASEQQIFESFIGEESPTYLGHHRVFKRALLPTTAYLEMAIAAGSYRWRTCQLVVENLIIQRGCMLPAGELISVQTLVTPSNNKSQQFQIFSQPEQNNQGEEKWALHATGKIRTETETTKTKIDLEKWQRECSQAREVKQHYQKLEQIGIEYGSSFQGIEKLWSGSNQALAKIKLPEELIGETIDYQFHPALLDAALQVIAQALPEADSEKTYLPVGVEEFKIYSSPGLSLWAYASVKMPIVENQEKLTTQVTIASPEGEIIATVEGLQVKLATQQALLGKESESITNWFYEIEWRTKGRLGRLLPPDFLVNPTEIVQKVKATVEELVTQVEQENTPEIGISLEELSIDYILQALLEMGWSYQPQESFELEGAVQRLGIVPGQRRLFQRLLQILAEVGILQSHQQQWQVQQILEKVNPTQQNQSLLNQYPEEAAILSLLDRCASQLSGVLRGAIDPVQLVFPQGDLTTATKVYQDSKAAKVMNKIVQKTITKAIEKLPQSRGVRLLEIGGGTGGTTSYIVPHLNHNQTEYTFTDIGALFTNKAQEKFQDYPFIRYQTLDIELEPTKQGFKAHQYDVIIAANVLHATTSIKQTLSHVEKLLAPGGILVLLEVTTQTKWADLVFGLLEGWWKFSDYELRPDYPLLSRQQWQKVLNEVGFTEVVSLPEVVEEMPEALSQETVIVSKAAQTTREAMVSEPKSWLILADAQGIAQHLARQLQAVGEICTLVYTSEKYQQIAPEEFTINPNNSAELEQVIKTLAAKFPSLYGVVQCWTTEAGVVQTISSEELENLSKLGCGTTLSLVQALVKAELSQPPRLWLVTSGAQGVPSNNPIIPGVAQSSVWGMGKVISLEHSELNCVRIDLDPNSTREGQGKVLFEEIWSEDAEDQVVCRGESRYVPRLVASAHQQQKVPSQPFKLGSSARGSLDNLILEPTTRRSPAAGEVEIRVKAAGLNFRDVLIALDIYPGEPIMGGECAGEIVAIGAEVTDFQMGDLVMAMAQGSFSQYVIVDANYVVLKPESLSFEEAASIPANFITAYYTLHHLAQIRAGESVLIHAAAGGTGMAAVQIAQQAGAEVFATASPTKWEALQQMGVKHIMNSRTVEFADQVMEITQGQGVNIVLNSLTSGEFISKSMSVVSPGGRFVEIAKRGVWDFSQVAQVRPDVSYFVVDLVRESQQQPELIHSLLQQLREQFGNGLLQVSPLKVFPLEEIISAFRYMQQAKHIGKIVVTQTKPSADATQPLSFREEATYLITGGMGGLGLLVARWMVERGARHLVLVGRRSPDNATSQKITELEMAGAQVVVEKADVSELESMTRVLHQIEQSQIPLAGVIHSAGMLSDGVLQNQSWSSFEQVMAPKVQGAWHLHQLTQNQSLDFFVLFSSVASLLGSPGQGNHCAANAFLDGLAHYRRGMGLSGLSIHWGAVSQVGEAAERGADLRLQKQGMGALSPAQVLESLERLMSGSDVEVGVAPMEWSMWQERVAKWPFLADWLQTIQTTFDESYKSEFLLKLEATAANERRSLLVAHIRRQLGLVLGINAPESISLETGFFDLGMDSLTSIELRNKLQTTFECSLPSSVAFDYPTVEKLVDYLAKDLLVEKEQILDDKEQVIEIDDIAKRLAEQLGAN